MDEEKTICGQSDCEGCLMKSRSPTFCKSWKGKFTNQSSLPREERLEQMDEFIADVKKWYMLGDVAFDVSVKQEVLS